jgi:uncharacterized protein YkwD
MKRQIRMKVIGTAVALGVSAAMVLTSTPTASARPVAPVSAREQARIEIGQDAWQLFQVTNASRGRFDLPKLLLDREMSAVARRHSVAMARAGALFHTTDVDVYLHGTAWHMWGENVGYTPTDVASVQQAFMESTPHRENILNRAFSHVAIGTVRVDGTLWVTVFFYA